MNGPVSRRFGYRMVDLREVPSLAVDGAGVGDATYRSPHPAGARLRRRPDGSWDADEVAAHLMACERQIVVGLATRSPWIGLDEETLASCYGHGAAVVARIAASSQQPAWRRPSDLEKAQIAAYRNQAFEHWRRVNTQSRRGDRFTVLFDPERHAGEHAPIDALFELPDLHAVEEDLLAELGSPELRRFWAIVLLERVSFKVAGDRLGLTRAAVTASTRAGRAQFEVYLERRASGELCADRAVAIEARRSGGATADQEEKARAHLAACYVCALVHEPRTSAFRRGILAVSPVGFILRWTGRGADGRHTLTTRLADASAATRALTAGVAAVAVAGSGLGLKAATSDPASRRPTGGAPRAAVAQPTLERISSASAAPRGVVEPVGRRLAGAVSVARTRGLGPTTPVTPFAHAPERAHKAPAPPAVARHPDEFDVEQGAQPARSSLPAPTATATAPAPSPPATNAGTTEFTTP